VRDGVTARGAVARVPTNSLGVTPESVSDVVAAVVPADRVPARTAGTDGKSATHALASRRTRSVSGASRDNRRKTGDSYGLA
jgi:hypothetical protein